MLEPKVLYKAVKLEAEEFHYDHGMNMAELWGIVTGRAKDVQGTPVSADMQMFWFTTCLNDYNMARAISRM